MKCETISRALYEYFMGNKYIQWLMPYDLVIMYITAGIIIMDDFISVQGVFVRMAYFLFVLAVAMLFSKYQYRNVAIALGLHTMDYCIYFLKALMREKPYFSSSYCLSICVYGLFAWLAYKKSLTQRQS